MKTKRSWQCKWNVRIQHESYKSRNFLSEKKMEFAKEKQQQILTKKKKGKQKCVN